MNVLQTKLSPYILAVIWSNLGYIAGLYKDFGGKVGLLCANLTLIYLWFKDAADHDNKTNQRAP